MEKTVYLHVAESEIGSEKLLMKKKNRNGKNKTKNHLPERPPYVEAHRVQPKEGGQKREMHENR